MSENLLRQIQNELVSSTPLSDTLRKAMVLAFRLEVTTLSTWIKSELNGYTNLEELPDYRKVPCQTYVDFFFSRGKVSHCPVNWEIEYLYRMEVIGGIKTLEDMVQDAKGNPNYTVNVMLSPFEFGFIRDHLAKERKQLISAYKQTTANACSQIIDTTKNRLLEFVLQLDSRAETSGQGIGTNMTNDEITLLFQQIIMGNAQFSKEIKNMSTFDQRGQHVNYQYNAAGDINFGTVQNQFQFIEELEKLQEELTRAIDAGTLDEEIATDANYQMTKAIQQAKKESPDKKSITDHLKTVVSLLGGVTAVTGLVKGVSEAIEAVQKLFA